MGTTSEKRKATNKRWYYRNPNYHNERRRKKRYEALCHYSGTPPKCQCCSESELNFLTFDHTDKQTGKPDRAQYGMGTAFMLSLIRRGYPEGIQVLCYNCNCAKGFYGACPHTRI